MFDLHCHLLPGIDDGPESLDDALAMARLARSNGITHAVVTPHILPGRYENSLEIIRTAAAQFALALQTLNIDLKIGYAAEVRIGPEIVRIVERGDMPFLGELNGYRLILVELPDSHIPMGSEKLVRWLLNHRIRPVIAHPERNKDVIRDAGKIGALANMGCLLQITAGSAIGTFGPHVLKTTRELLERNWVNIMASDAHNLGVRQPDLARGRDAAEEIIGSEAAWALVRDTPQAISRQHFAAA